MREIKLRPRAQLDLESIYLCQAVTLSSPKAADSMVARLYESIKRLAEHPTLGTCFEDPDLVQPYRRMLSKPYWIYCTFDEASIVIWHSSTPGRTSTSSRSSICHNRTKQGGLDAKGSLPKCSK